MKLVEAVVPTCVHALAPSGERWTWYPVAPDEAFQLTVTWDELRAFAATPVGAAGACGAAPNSTPETTAFMPAVRVTVIVNVPPAATLICALTHAPCEKSVEMVAVCGPEPSFTVRTSRRTSWSQSTA